MINRHGRLAYRVAKTLLNRPLRRAFDLDVVDAQRVPTHGPCIVVANHRSFMDSIFLALVVDRPLTFMAKAEYWDNPRTAWLFRGTGQIPVRRGSLKGAKDALDAAKDVLHDGGVIALYPEGTRSRTGVLQAGALGAARLAVATGAPILPVGLIGTEQVQAPDQRLPRLGKRVGLRFGDLLFADRESNRRAAMVGLTDDAMHAIASLSDQRYLDLRDQSLSRA